MDGFDIKGQVNDILDNGFAQIAFVDDTDRGRPYSVGAITSVDDDLSVFAERNLILNGSTVLFQSDTEFNCDEVSIDAGSEGLKIWVGKRYWTFSNTGIYYCDRDGTHVNSVMLSN